MCEHGDEIVLRVPVAARDSHTGKMRWASKGVDRCIAPLVEALNGAGIFTRSCCCGHKVRQGEIILHDGRILRVDTVVMLCLSCGHSRKSHTYSVGHCCATRGSGPIGKTGRCRCPRFIEYSDFTPTPPREDR